MQKPLMNLRKEHWASYALSLLILLFGITYLGVNLGKVAHQKWFWADEGQSLVATCSETLGAQLIQGARGQCSPHPLYYLFERVLLRSDIATSLDLLLRTRILSLASAAGTLLTIWILFSLAGAPWVGLIAAFALGSQNVFQHFAIESRPYELWVFCFSLTFLATTSLVKKSQNHWILHWLFFLGASIALTLVAAPGFMQVAGFCGAAIFLRLRSAPGSWSLALRGNPSWGFVAVALLSALLGYYYTKRGCVHGYNADPFDLLKSKDWNLLLGFFRLWLPKLPLWASIAHLVFFVGIFTVIRLILDHARNRATRETSNFSFHLATVLLIQTIIVFAIAGAVAYSHYYFVQRMFITAMVLQAAWLGLGLLSLSKGFPRLRVPLVAYLCLVFTCIFLLQSRKYVDSPSSPPVRIGSIDLICREPGPLQLLVPLAAQIDIHARPLNEFVLLRRLRKQCGSPGIAVGSPTDAPKSFLLRHNDTSTELELFLGDAKPGAHAIVKLCGSPLLLR